MARFEDAIDFVIKNEVGNYPNGGYVNHPADPGGETKWGISKRANPTVDIKNLTLEGAKEIYRKKYWLFDGITTQAVATKLFDSYVNMGHAAIKQAQAIVGSTQDGFYGPNTEAKINALDPVKFLSYYRVWLVRYYEDLVTAKPEMKVFLNGWIRRANS